MADAKAVAELSAQFGSFGRLLGAELDGLTEDQLDWSSDRYEWAGWSIRNNVSHMASLMIRWPLLRMGPVLFPDGKPVLDEQNLLMESKYDRRLDDDVYWDAPVLQDKLSQALAMTQDILARDSSEGVLDLEATVDFGGSFERHPEMYPGEVRKGDGDPPLWHVKVGAVMRHMYYELVTHLFNVQRLKRAQGLQSSVSIPEVGYWMLPEWDRSEP